MDNLMTMLRAPEFHIFHHAPALIIIAAPLGVRWGMEGCVLAAENVMLAATALGLGTCWIGMAEGWLNSGAGRAVLHLPDATHVVAPIAVGYQKETPAPVPRQKPEVTWLDGLGGPVFEHEETRNISTRAGLYHNLIHP
jgi:nitroreductase